MNVSFILTKFAAIPAEFSAASSSSITMHSTALQRQTSTEFISQDYLTLWTTAANQSCNKGNIFIGVNGPWSLRLHPLLLFNNCAFSNSSYIFFPSFFFDTIDKGVHVKKGGRGAISTGHFAGFDEKDFVFPYLCQNNVIKAMKAKPVVVRTHNLARSNQNFMARHTNALRAIASNVCASADSDDAPISISTA
jgi:hypothetical protein